MFNILYLIVAFATDGEKSLVSPIANVGTCGTWRAHINGCSAENTDEAEYKNLLVAWNTDITHRMESLLKEVKNEINWLEKIFTNLENFYSHMS